MIILDVEQGSPEWFSARAGIPTASSFDKLITTKGEPSKQAKTYLYKLAAEHFIGSSEDNYSNAAIERGKALEHDARLFYEFTTGNEVEQVGLVYADDNKQYSCSPDGIINRYKGLEIKCPLPSTHVKYLLGGKLPTDYFQQVHGSMFVTGFKEWDFLSYCPGLPPLLLTIKRDEGFCFSLGVVIKKFCQELDAVKNEISLISE